VPLHHPGGASDAGRVIPGAVDDANNDAADDAANDASAPGMDPLNPSFIQEYLASFIPAEDNDYRM